MQKLLWQIEDLIYRKRRETVIPENLPSACRQVRRNAESNPGIIMWAEWIPGEVTDDHSVLQAVFDQAFDIDEIRARGRMFT